MRQGAQPLEIFRREFVARPDGGGRSHGIEVVEVHESGGGFVVIAADENLSQSPRARSVTSLGLAP